MNRKLIALALAFLGPSLLHGAETGELRIEGGPFEPYGISRAFIVRPGGLLGKLRVLGLAWEGPPRLLFEAELDDFAESLEIAFYLDEDEKALLLKYDGPEGRSSLEYSLFRPETEATSELALRSRIRALPLPFRDPPHRSPPEHLILAEDSLESAGRKAASELFALPGPGAAVPALAGFALLVILLTLVPKTRQREGRLCFLALVLGSALALSLALPNKALLYIASLPSADPGASFSGRLDARLEKRAEATIREYGEDGSIDFIGIHAPSGRALPLELLERDRARFHFNQSPLIRAVDGELYLETSGFLLGWRLYERP